MKYWNRIERFFLCYIGKHRWRDLTQSESSYFYGMYVRGGPVVFKRCDRCHQIKTL